MISISERLRARHEPVGDGTGKWRPDGLCQEAAEIIDALVAALEEASKAILNCDRLGNHELYGVIEKIDAALAKAKGKQE